MPLTDTSGIRLHTWEKRVGTKLFHTLKLIWSKNLGIKVIFNFFHRVQSFTFCPYLITGWTKGSAPFLMNISAVFARADIGNLPRERHRDTSPCLLTRRLRITHRQSKAGDPQSWPWEGLKQFNTIRRWEWRGSCSKFGEQRTVRPSDADTSPGTCSDSISVSQT